jgi:hypothetical protein
MRMHSVLANQVQKHNHTSERLQQLQPRQPHSHLVCLAVDAQAQQAAQSTQAPSLAQTTALQATLTSGLPAR